MLTVLCCVYIDRRKKRVHALPKPLTVIIPCFNDAATVCGTIESVFASWPEGLLEVIVINDASTDDSRNQILSAIDGRRVEFIDHSSNKGKSASLNEAVTRAAHTCILCLDADMILSSEALMDMLSRLESEPRMGAVSCPYSPVNRGFLAAMQSIEYSMLRLGQGAGNVTSAIALWGGCLMVRKQAFEAVGAFSANAITEDVDLAFKLNRAGYKVEQSFVFIKTHVPDRWRKWIRQKIRWTSGGMQCVFRYPGVWIRNPLQMMFILSYALLTISGVCGMMADTSLINIGRDIVALWTNEIPLESIWKVTHLLYGPVLFAKLLVTVFFSLFSVVYVIPTMTRIQDWIRIGLIVPFSIGYFPFYILISILGFFFWFFALRRLSAERRAW